MARVVHQAMEAAGMDITFQHRVKRSDGTVRSCIWTGHIVRDHAGKAVHVLGTVRAIPEAHESSQHRSGT
jgi:hypothetical protein